MNTLPYQQAFDRIRAEFLEMPGMRLTAEQLERLSGVDRAVCECVLEDLIRARFLCRWPNDSFGRVSDSASRTQKDGVDLNRSRVYAARHAS